MSRKYGNHVSQTALRTSFETGVAAPSLVEGVVVGIHYPDDTTNRSQVEVEYDVDVTSVVGMGRLRNVPRGDVAAGIDDGDDNILRVANEEASGGQWVPDGDSKRRRPPTPRYQSSGDRVLVGFVNGNAYRPVILGVMAHFTSRMQVKKQPLKDVTGKTLAGASEKKRIRRTRHRGTEMVMDDSGNVTVNFAKTPDANGRETNDKKKLTLNIGDFEIRIDNSSSPTTCEFKAKGGGPILKFTKDGFEVGASGLEPMVLGETLKNLLDSILTDLATHMHVGNLGAPTPRVDGGAGAQALKAQTPTIKSDWAKVTKAKP